MTRCSVFRCGENGGFKFPKDKKLRSAWVKAIDRDPNWQPTDSSVVCRKHFRSEDFKTTGCEGDLLMTCHLKEGVVPSVFERKRSKLDELFGTSSTEDASVGVGATQTASLNVDATQTASLDVSATEIVLDSLAQVSDYENKDKIFSLCKRSNEVQFSETGVNVIESDSSNDNFSSEKRFRDVEIQCTQNVSLNSSKSTETQTEKLLSFNQRIQTQHTFFSVYDFVNDKKSLHHYTGLEHFSKFQFVFETLGPSRFHLTYYNNKKPPSKIIEIDQFFLTLIYLRLHRTFYDLGVMFKITEKQAHNIAVTWIKFMNLQWRRINIWPSKELVNFYSPNDFYSKYPDTRVIIDGTEIPIFRPSLPIAQQSTFSQYKHKNTVKVVVGSSPGGLVTYVSPSFGGSASDRQIVERVDLAQKFEPGDHIMADKGFDIDDLLAPYRVHINVPTYFRKRNRISPNVLSRDRKIASKRVHIERIIGLAKTYTILKGPLKKSEIYLADEISFVCFMLCNFRKKIVGNDA